MERIFSALNNIKTDNRNCLSTDAISALIHTKQGIEKSHQNLLNFEPNDKMLNTPIWAKDKYTIK